MPECPHCSGAVEEGAGHICPRCGADMLLPPDSGRPSPFNPADLAADLDLAPPPLPPGGASEARDAASPRPRVISSAGPARPVPGTGRGGDTAVTGWGAAPPTGGWGDAAVPPPLPPRKKKAKPAHLLLAELEAKRAAEEKRVSEDLSLDMPAAEIARAKVAKPAVPTARRGPSDRTIRTIAGLVVAAGIFGVYYTAQLEPEPEIEVDAALQAEVERRRKAVEALQQGHDLVVQGPKKADAAIAAYTKALELEPGLAAAERGLGISYAAKEQDARAVRHYRRYLELEPDADDADEVKAIISAYEKAKRRQR